MLAPTAAWDVGFDAGHDMCEGLGFGRKTELGVVLYGYPLRRCPFFSLGSVNPRAETKYFYIASHI